jgi:hypothetical protein
MHDIVKSVTILEGSRRVCAFQYPRLNWLAMAVPQPMQPAAAAFDPALISVVRLAESDHECGWS